MDQRITLPEHAGMCYVNSFVTLTELKETVHLQTAAIM